MSVPDDGSSSRLQNKVIVRTKNFQLRAKLPDFLSTTSYYLDEYFVCDGEEAVVTLAKQFAASGQAKGWIPVTKDLYALLSKHGITFNRTTKDDGSGVDHSGKFAIIPIGMIQGQTQEKRRDTFVIGEAKRMLTQQPYLLMTVGEAALKSRLHAAEMLNALMKRVQCMLAPQFIATRKGDTAMGISLKFGEKEPPLPSEGEATVVVPQAMSPAPIKRRSRKEKNIPKAQRKAPQRRRKKPAENEQVKTSTVAALKNSVPKDEPVEENEEEDDDRTAPDADEESQENELEVAVEQLERLAAETAAKVAAQVAALPLAERIRRKALEKWFPLQDLALVPGIAKIYDARIPEEYKANLPTYAEVKHGRLLADGANGVPILSSQKALCMMSGGIDSPVAAYQMMRRGCHVDSVHYMNSTGDIADIMTKLTLISKRLSYLQGRLDLYVVDIAQLQSAIIAVAARTDRTLLYKQFMLLISAAIPEYQLIVTGDSVGQVASQTPHNLSALYPNVGRAIMSPLCGQNKVDVMKEARKLGLYDFSIMQGADCCQYLTCTTGANLCISPAKLRTYMTKIAVTSFKIDVYTFENGKELPSMKKTISLPFSEVVQRNPSLSGNFTPLRAGLQRKIAEGTLDPESRAKMFQLGGSYAAAAAAIAGDDDTPLEESTPFKVVKVEKIGVASETLYFDANASALIHPFVVDAMARAPKGNPNSLHAVGRAAQAAVEAVRYQVLHYVTENPKGHRCIFTAGGTESNNIAILGIAPICGTVLYSCIAHPSVTQPCESLKGQLQVETIPVHSDALLNLETLEKLLRAAHKAWNKAKTIFPTLLCIDIVHHETGVIQHMDKICALAKQYNAVVHVDACQALGKVEFDAAHFDSVSVSAHKVNGPGGTGALILRNSIAEKMSKAFHGGSYDGGLRPGTMNTVGVVGFGAALSLDRETNLMTQAFNLLKTGIEGLGLRINGNPERLSGCVIHCTITDPPLGPGKKAMSESDITSLLSAKYGIMVSSGAACSASKDAASGAEETKEIYKHLGIVGGPTLRISFDYTVRLEDCQVLLNALKAVLKGTSK